MNLILMKTRNEHINAWWEPYATSTPLKKISDQLEVNKTPKLIIQTKSTSKNLRDKSRKKRKSNFFDLSSSSDDDLSDTERPVIKLNSKKSTKVFYKDKNSESKHSSVKRIIGEQRTSTNLENVDVKNMGVVSKEKNVFAMENSKNNNFGAQITSDFCRDLISPDSDEENIIEKSSIKKNIVKGIKNHPKGKANLLSDLKINEHFTFPNDFNEIERKALQIFPEKKQILAFQSVERNSDQNNQDMNCIQVEKMQNSKLTKFQNKKSNKVNNNKGFLKKKTLEVDCKNKPNTPKKVLCSVNPFQISQNKSNISHQLFSESTEQEYINTLDLTTNEVDECPETTRCSLQKRKNRQSFIWPHHSSHKVCTGGKVKKVRPQKRKKKLENQPYNSCHRINESEEAQNVSLVPKDAEKRSKEEDPNMSYKKKDFISPNISEKEAVKELTSATENDKMGDGFINVNFDNRRVLGGVSNFFDPSGEINISTECNEVHNKNTFKFIEEGKIINSTEESVFKQSDELPFKENGSGCSVVQCWNTKNFKCGVFKLKMKANLTCKTLHRNSSLGGVLLKGNLKMRIGIKEQNLKEGDMAFVPPLTEWQATNNGKSESVFYYWCGRF